MKLRPPRNRRHLMVGAASLTAALVLTACSAETSATPDKGYISGDGVIEQIAGPDRRKLPPITGGLLDGDQFDSRDHLGEVVVYNVWGSWCAPCRKEAPALRKVWNQTRERGVQFVGLNVKDNDTAARAFERRFKITYPSITTADSGKALLDFGSSLPRSAIPSTIVVDPQGRVAARVIGPTTYHTLTALVEETLAEAR